MTQATPFSRRVEARVAFVRALARETDAIRELRAWPLPPSARNSERERKLRELVTPGGAIYALWVSRDLEKQTDVIHERRDERRSNSLPPGTTNHVSMSWFGLSRAALFGLAGTDRVDAALAWARKLRLGDAPWLHKWAVFALLWWDIYRCCTLPECPHGCVAVDGDDDMDALKLVLTVDILRDLEAQDGTNVTTVATDGDFHGPFTFMTGGADYLPSGIKPVAPLLGPDPLLETREEAVRRMLTAWDEAAAEMAQQGLSVRVPRKLELHCTWLVRYHVQDQTAAEIVKDVEDTDPSTVYKAVRSVAHVLGLPIRET